MDELNNSGAAVIVEPERSIPVLSSYDTVVCGGGIAGISAALAASRGGSNTLLIEREYSLGGLATLGLVTIYLPISDGNGKQYSYGIAEELLRLSAKHGYIHLRTIEGNKATSISNAALPKMSVRLKLEYDPNVFSVETERLLLDSGVNILYGSSVCDVKCENDKITHIIIENKDGRTAVAAKNVIDCTGDADICYLAGENTVNNGKGNVLASWYYSIEDGENKLHMLGFSDDGLPEKVESNEAEIKYSGLNQKEITEFMIKSHSSSLHSFLKKGGCNSKRSMTSMTSIPQFRMTRRIDGIYTQDISEIRCEYEDSVGMFVNWRKVGPAYELPFSCLKGRKIKNLLAAGRCISSTDDMWDLTRVIPVCAVSGQAAGTAAALFDAFDNIDIKKLQSTLQNNNVILHERDI